MRNKKEANKTTPTSIKKNVIKNKRLCYSSESVALALQEVRQGKRIAEVSRKYGIPESTVRSKHLGLYADKKPGPATVLSVDEEKELVQWIFHCFDKGFPVTKNQLQESVRTICINMKKKNPFTNSTPGRSWLDGFMKRHPEIGKKICEKVSVNKTIQPECSLHKWYKEVSQFLSEKSITTIEPNRVFYCDESGISQNPVPSSALAPQGQNVVNDNEQENITVLVTANATGNLAPTHVLFTGDSLPANTIEMAPADFTFGFSNFGWMTSENFYEYIANAFEPWLTKNNIKRPVMLFLDRHTSHMTLQLNKFCSENEIFLIALHSTCTNIMQLLDVSIFPALKAQWQMTIEQFCRDSFSVGIQKYQFAPLLKKTLESMELEEMLQNAFQKCGLHPFDFNAIDMNKIMKQSQDSKSANNPQVSRCNCQTEQNSLKVFESFLTPEQVEAFRLNEGPVWRGIKKDEGLFNIWYKLLPPCDLTNTIFIVEPKIEEVEFPDDPDSCS